MMLRVALLVILLALTPSGAQAQTTPVPVRFVGTITASAPDTLMIRGANGQMVPWTGPLPDFPYVAGDQITVSFNAVPGSATQSADGLYRYTLVGPAQAGTITGGNTAATGPVDVSGPIAGGGGVNGLTLTYNAATGSYGLETGPNGYTMFPFDGPGYRYDPGTNSLSLTSTTRDPRAPCSDQNLGCFNITGDLTGGAVNRAPVFADDGSLWGLFSILFSGNWFVNGQQVGGPTQVPEPGQTGLFALALLAVTLRGRRRRAVMA